MTGLRKETTEHITGSVTIQNVRNTYVTINVHDNHMVCHAIVYLINMVCVRRCPSLECRWNPDVDERAGSGTPRGRNENKTYSAVTVDTIDVL